MFSHCLGVLLMFCLSLNSYFLQTNLTVDWNGSPLNYTCYTPKNRLVPDPQIQALIIKDNLPTAYQVLFHIPVFFLCIIYQLIYVKFYIHPNKLNEL